MSVDAILAAIPTMDAQKRANIRNNAEARLSHPSSGEDARRVINALDAQIELDAHVLSEQVSRLPIARRVIEAFTHQPMSETERKIIQVLLDNPGLSSEGLSQKLGWGAQSWHMHFGEMCKKRETRLWPAENAVVRNAAFFSGILAEWAEQSGWKMKPDVAEAFSGLGLKAK
ncbi:hypothetical protein MesoLj113a_05300 [Mesorhizobium sp. 113-1-2]|uniref:hypothetical protein n=1 Tax=Mesorhizobium sp. 113-1-2 TaxID=2744515 RepID=UPI0019259F50|nr:hypothetical protein [Mesorhizobium sp. 113-1-2]BCG69372.1 hypothetical protein MesoLj113a_05300 [Mesorhizobium sp. 113-1-2]